MTKVLVITNKTDLTSDLIVSRLKKRNISFYRLNTEELFKSCFLTLDFGQDSFFIFDSALNRKIDLREFSAVYFRRPKLPQVDIDVLSQEENLFLRKETYYVLEGVYKLLRGLYWVSPIHAIREAENKIYQLSLARRIGFIVPNSIITNIYEDAIDFYNKNDADCIIKPIKTGLVESSEKSMVLFTSKLKKKPERGQVESIPVFLQNNVNKMCDVRVTMVGEKAFAVSIDSQSDEISSIDWRRADFPLKHTRIELPDEIVEKSITLLRTLNLKFGALDFILDANGNFIFLEINPNGQWAWIEKEVGYEISNEIVNLLEYEYF